MVWVVAGLFVGDWIAWQLVNPDLTFDASLVELRTPPSGAHLRRHLRLRRQRADRNVAVCPAAHVARAVARPVEPVVRAARLQSVLRHRRDRLPDGCHAVEGICRTGMVRGHLAGDRVGDLFHHLPAHAGSPQGAAHLCVELVLHGLHSGRGDPSHRQQSGDPGVARACQELFGLFRRAGCDDAVVVWTQRRRVLPDRRLPRHDVLLLAGSRRPPDFLLSAVDHQLLGHHLHVHVGGLASPALHGAAAMGADAWHDVLGHAAGAVMGVGRQRAPDAERRLAQGSRRRDPALHDGRGGVLRPGDVRRIVHGDPLRQLAVALY